GGWNITTFFNNLPTNGVDTDSEAIAFTDTGLVVYDAVNPAIFTIPTQTIPGPPPAEDLNITVDFHGLTLYDAEWTAWPETQDGYAEGELRSYSIDNTGTIIGSYSNGQTQNIAQVALATFQNPAGLQLIGENMYAQSVNSGDANPSAPGVGGKGFIVPGALEMSNVDLAQEFTDMIITQRGFQANSRIISTSDEMLQELVNLKR
ncbi:MAG: flagellar hook-basal body complex protein, partial [Syntrophomonadaceae bacterium]|nr:flagellar hook-basal body complex protein [Syntrophomonadaceae bacterium]